MLSVVPSLAVEVDRSKIIKRLQQTFSLYMESAHKGSVADCLWLPAAFPSQSYELSYSLLTKENSRIFLPEPGA